MTNLKQLFNKFSGKEVKVIEKPQTFRVGGELIKTTTYELDKKDSIVKEMNKVAKKEGLTLFFALPGHYHTMEVNPKRITVPLEKGSDKKWRVGTKFRAG